MEIIKGPHGPIFLAAEKKIRFSDEIRHRDRMELIEVAFDLPDPVRRMELWCDALKGSVGKKDPLNVEKLARRYRFTEDQMYALS